MYKKNLAIYGAGGLGSEIYELASRIFAERMELSCCQTL